MYTTFLYLRDNFWFNTIWYRRFVVAALIFCGRRTESDVILTPSVTCMDWLHWWYNHATNVHPLLQHLTFLANMSDKHTSTSPNEIQVKNQWKTSSMEVKVDVISRFEKCEWTVDICHNVRLTYSSICTIRDSADGIKESAKSRAEVFV
jgi:hypothetical protein